MRGGRLTASGPSRLLVLFWSGAGLVGSVSPQCKESKLEGNQRILKEAFLMCLPDEVMK